MRPASIDGKTYQFALELAPFENPTFNFDGNARSYGVQLKQPLFRGFRTQAETEATEKQVLAGRAKLGSAEQQLFLDTASAYLGVLRDEAVLELERNHEAVLEDKLKETKVRSQKRAKPDRHGRSPGGDAAGARPCQPLPGGDHFDAGSRGLRTAGGSGMRRGSCRLPPLRLDSPRTACHRHAFHLAESQNPDVVSAQFAAEEAKAEIRLNKGSLLPEIDLVGNSGRNWGQNITVPGREDSSQILVQLTVPLYRSGTDYSKARAAQQTYSQRRDELDEARHKAHETADNAWQALMTAQAALDADKSEVDAAAEALKGVTEESKVGTRTTLDVLNAEQELLDAKIDQVRSQHDRDLAVLQIKAATGDADGGQSQAFRRATYDPKRHYEDVRNQWAGFSKDDARYKVAPPATSATIAVSTNHVVPT